MQPYAFGAQLRLKLAQGHQPRPPANVGAPKPPGSSLPQAPTSTWGGYLTDTNNGLMKDVKDYFTHSVPQNIPGTQSYATRGARFKNLPVDKALGYGATAGAGMAAASGTAAAGLAAAPLVGGTTIGSMPLMAGGSGVAAMTQTPAGQNMMQRLPQLASRASNLFQSQILPRANTAADTLNRLNYPPNVAAQDAYAAATGHFDQISGPGFGGRLAPLNPLTGPGISQGAPMGPSSIGSGVKPLSLARDAFTSLGMFGR